jgi:hypothetical protein
VQQDVLGGKLTHGAVGKNRFEFDGARLVKKGDVELEAATAAITTAALFR